MTPRPLSLSSDQLRIVRETAKALPIEFRDRYLQNIADALLPHDVLTDDLVSKAASDVITRMFSGSVA